MFMTRDGSPERFLVELALEFRALFIVSVSTTVARCFFVCAARRSRTYTYAQRVND